MSCLFRAVERGGGGGGRGHQQLMQSHRTTEQLKLKQCLRDANQLVLNCNFVFSTVHSRYHRAEYHP